MRNELKPKVVQKSDALSNDVFFFFVGLFSRHLLSISRYFGYDPSSFNQWFSISYQTKRLFL